MAVQNGYGSMAAIIVLLIFLAAIIKSAQFPFTSWLPRAMEGPTSSSAIFYGSLSVHIGVFILLRTWPFWQDLLWAKVVVITIGAITGIMSTLIARVQATVKTQIAYSSAAQIGIIFIEVALGFHTLALIHFAGNAFLRTYQLLVSPSVLNYLVHHQYFHYEEAKEKPVNKFKLGLYMLGIKEWNLDTFMHAFLWQPFKWIGNKFQFLNLPAGAIIAVLAGITALVLSIMKSPTLHEFHYGIAITLAAVALSIILFAFANRRSALTTWLYLLLSHIFIFSAINLIAVRIPVIEMIFYASGIGAAFLLGYYCLQKIKGIDNDILLNNYHGYSYEQRTTSLLFLVAATGLLGFPVTAAFIGIDVMFTYVGSNQPALIILLALCFIFIELAAIRIYCRIFLGLHKKLNHPVAFRSS
jgi:NADH-quinone oxidoreductase subunit L